MSEQIGQQLRQAREAKQVSLAQAARETLIRAHYLQALEAGDLNAIPSVTQARGFLRAYAAYLHLDPDQLIILLDGDAPATHSNDDVETNPVTTTSANISSADEIFQQIGQKLQHQRSLLGLTLEDVERHTHLRQHYLTALENGDLKNMPSPFQGRGMLKNYASFLGLDPEPVLLQFAEGLQTRLVASQATRPTNNKEPVRPARPLPGPLQRLFSGDMLVAALVSIVLISFIIWGAARIFSVQSENQTSPTAPSIAEVLLVTPSSTPTVTPLPATPSPPAAPIPGFVDESPTTETPGFLPLPAGQEGVQIYISVYQRAYMQVSVDGEIEFEGRVLPGSAYNFQGEERVELLTGNGAALQVFFNQQDRGILGLFGEIVYEVYTIEGVQTPTPTITPTSTITPRPSPTPRLTATQESGQPAIP